MDNVKKNLIEKQVEVEMIANTLQFVKETPSATQVKHQEELQDMLLQKVTEVRELNAVPRVSLQLLIEAHNANCL